MKVSVANVLAQPLLKRNHFDFAEAGVIGVFMQQVLAKVILPTFIICLMGWGLSNYFTLAFNTTDSLNGVVFLVDKTSQPERGDMAAFKPPPSSLLTTQKGYLSTAPFLKKVMGVAFDEVTMTDTDVFVNKKRLGPIFNQTPSGDYLAPTKSGLVPAKHYFMGTRHESSYDSRYASIGYIHEDRVIGRAIRLF
jgi:conjugative transfer signal peptidase TraF